MPSKNLKSQISNLKATTQNSKVSKETKKPVVKSVKAETKEVAKPVLKKKEEKIEATVAVQPKIAKKKSIKPVKAEVYDTKGKVVEEINLPGDMFGAKINHGLLAQAVRVYLANQRAGTASTKTRGEVKGSTRKIYRQKGTGRARHGSLRAPIFVHGGVAFGPKPRDYSLKLPKKMKKKALCSALSAKIKDGEVKIVSGLEKIVPKTKKMVEVIKNLNLENQKLLIILSNPPAGGEENIDRAARNIKGVEMTLANQLNAYEVLNATMLLFTKDAITKLD